MEIRVTKQRKTCEPVVPTTIQTYAMPGRQSQMNSTNSCRSVLGALAILASVAMGLSWLIPNHYQPWVSFYNDSMMAVSLVLLAMGSFLLRPQGGPPITSCVVVAVVTIPWVQHAFGLLSYSGDAWISSLYLLGFGLAIAIGHRWQRSDNEDLPLLLSIAAIVAAVVSSVIAMVQSLHGGVLGIWSLDGQPGMRAVGNLGQPNNLATLMGFGAVGLLYLREKRRLGLSLAAMVLAVLIVGTALTRSRTALLFGPLILLSIYYYQRRSPGSLYVSIKAITAAVVLHWTAAFASDYVHTALDITTAYPIADRGLGTSRWTIWPMFLEALGNAPWFGYGWLQTGAAMYEVAERFHPIEELFLHSHNLFLDLMLWSGYPIGLLLAGLIVRWFWTRARRVNSLEAICGMLIVVVLGTHSMLELPHQYAYFLIPTGLWIGVIEGSIQARSFRSPHWTTATLLMGGALLIAVWKDYKTVEEEFRVFRFEQLRIGNVSSNRSLPDSPLMSSVTSYMRVYRYPTDRLLTHDELGELARLARRFPYGNTLYKYSLALARNGELNEAVRVFVKLRHIHGEAAELQFELELQRQIQSGAADLRDLQTALLEMR